MRTKYDINNGIQKLKTKASLTVSALALTAAGGIMAVAIPLGAHADSNSINFESYNLGTINGQDGWTSTGAAGSGCAIYDHQVSSSLGTLGFGSKSLRISNAVVSGCFGDQTFAKPLTNAVGEVDSTASTYSTGTLQRHYEMQFDIASTVPGAQQPGLYASVSPDRGDGSRMSYLRFEDQADGVHVFFDDVTSATNLPGSDTFNETDIGTLNRSVPNTIKLTMDTLDGPSNDVVKVWINGTLKITGTSWEDYYRYDAEASAEQSPRIVKTVLFRTGGMQGVDNAPATLGHGFLFDNLSQLSGPIPVNMPTNKDQCKGDGWKAFGSTFKNQGDCVSFVATGGKNQPSGH